MNAIEIKELEMESGEGMLFAWGIHDAVDFIAAASEYGVEPSDAQRVEHGCWHYYPKARRGDGWYDVAMGEPNATVLRP